MSRLLSNVTCGSESPDVPSPTPAGPTLDRSCGREAVSPGVGGLPFRSDGRDRVGQKVSGPLLLQSVPLSLPRRPRPGTGRQVYPNVSETDLLPPTERPTGLHGRSFSFRTTQAGQQARLAPTAPAGRETQRREEERWRRGHTPGPPRTVVEHGARLLECPGDPYSERRRRGRDVLFLVRLKEGH